MKVVIIEDEKPAADKLQKALVNYDEAVEVIAILKSVNEAQKWLRLNSMPDLVFMDIELSDGLSFKIFDETNITCPIIFTTAYDEYWQEAFEHNSIDYLLKPIKQEKLETAMGKYETLKKHFAQNLQQLRAQQSAPTGIKKRFLVKRGADYISIKTEEIAYFYAAHKVVCLVDTKTGISSYLDQSLSDLEKQVDSCNILSRQQEISCSYQRHKKNESLSEKQNPIRDGAGRYRRDHYQPGECRIF